MSFSEGSQGPSEFEAQVDFTAELAEDNPDWKIDLNDDVIGRWRGEEGKAAEMTLVWGVPLLPGGAIVTAELANLAVDQCELLEDRFTLIAPDNYRGTSSRSSFGTAAAMSSPANRCTSTTRTRTTSRRHRATLGWVGSGAYESEGDPGGCSGRRDRRV